MGYIEGSFEQHLLGNDQINRKHNTTKCNKNIRKHRKHTNDNKSADLGRHKARNK